MSEEKRSEEESLGLLGRISLFYRQVISELRKVVWPTRQQLSTYTAVVLVFVGFIIAVVSTTSSSETTAIMNPTKTKTTAV